MALVKYNIPDQNKMIEDVITTQFRDQPVVGKYLRLWVEELQELFVTFQSLAQDRDIDSATGDVLDIIGRIVGQERTIVGGDLYDFFGFRGHIQSLGFGDTYTDGVGGLWWSLGAPMGGDVTMTDEQYRLAIKARIMRNTARGTPEDVLKYIRFVFGVNGKFAWNEGAVARVGVGRKLSNFEKALIAAEFSFQKYPTYYSPKPLGVALELYEYDSVGTLGFIGTPGAKGMISLSTPNPDGGIFATVKYFEEVPQNPPAYESDFSKDPYLPANMNFTRSTTATYTGLDGILQTASANEPRFEYNWDGSFRGLLLEETRTNFALNSSTLTNWVKTNSSVAATTTKGLDGVTNAVKLVESNATGEHTVAFAFTPESSSQYVFSVYAKPAERDAINISFRNFANQVSGTNFRVNLNTLVVAGASATEVCTAERASNGWVRVTVSTTTIANSGVITPCILVATADLTYNYTGDGVSGVLLWGAQVEKGDSPSSYIPTTTTTATRSADICKTTALSLPYDGFAAYVDYTKFSGSSGYAIMFSDTSNALGSYVGLRGLPTNGYVNSTEGARTRTLPALPAPNPVRGAFYVSNNAPLNRFAQNGVLAEEQVSTFPVVNLGARNIMKLGTTSSAVSGIWYIRKYAIYTYPLSADQLNYLTYVQ